MGTALYSQVCHYCGGKATTDDHIVPRALLPKPLSRIPYWYRYNLCVPACMDCNGHKAHFRSDCACGHCTWAWKTALKLFIPTVKPDFDYDNHPVRKIVRSPG